jgi:hypothetical protein
MVARKAYIDLLIKESKSSAASTIYNDPEAIIKYVTKVFYFHCFIKLNIIYFTLYLFTFFVNLFQRL